MHETFEHAGRVGRIIRLEDLLRFQSEYVPAATLAKQTETSSRFLMARLKEAGVELVGAFQDGPAWRGHLIPLAALTSEVLATCSDVMLHATSASVRETEVEKTRDKARCPHDGPQG